jgi:predicted alpha-1,2-mannosidase
MKKSIQLFNYSILLCLALLYSCNKAEKSQENKEATSEGKLNLTQYVDPLIGSGFHGHVFVGANVPFGAVQLGPTQISEGWDWCSGYHYSDSIIIGFSHTHLSGTGIGDLGDIMLMPVTGDVQLSRGKAGDSKSGFGSLFSHDEETVRPGYYSVKLNRYDIKAELTTSQRVGLHRYSYPAGQEAKLLVSLKEGIGWDSPTETYLKQVNDSTITGYRFSKGWAEDQRIFFTMVFSLPIQSSTFFENDQSLAGKEEKGKALRAMVQFAPGADRPLLVKVALSPVSVENASANMVAEMPGWNFEQVAKNADYSWNEELNKVEIKTKNEADMRKFYTALYHTMIAPSIFNDANGDYLGTDKRVYHDTSFTNLTTFSLWDTYRGAHPLFTLLQTERVNDMINSMLAIYKQQGKLPVWHLMGNETNTMPGNSAFPVIADAYLKGFKGFDGALALEAMKVSSMRDERGLKYVLEKGYIPADSEVESVAKGLEYSIDDACAALLAKKLGHDEEYKFFSKRALNYRNYFDTTTRFVRGRISDTQWRTPFSPFIARHMKDDFSEGNAWQYTWLVPHDVEGLIKLMGGEEKFIEKLDSLFTVKGNMGKEASADITGLIGQYAHGNEPSHHIPYLYAYAGQPWKTASKVRYILDSLYSDTPEGLSGNEDVGQMSAWFVLSSIGFYQVHPANGAYIFGSPLVDEAKLHLPNGKTFTVLTENNNSKNIYIQGVTLNDKPYTKTYLLYEDIMKGGKLVIKMGNAPAKEWGIKKEDWAKSTLGN